MKVRRILFSSFTLDDIKCKRVIRVDFLAMNQFCRCKVSVFECEESEFCKVLLELKSMFSYDTIEVMSVSVVSNE